MLQAELEELQRKYWQCFNNWDCEEDLEKIYCQIEELKYKLSEKLDEELTSLPFSFRKTVIGIHSPTTMSSLRLSPLRSAHSASVIIPGCLSAAHTSFVRSENFPVLSLIRIKLLGASG